MIHVANCLFIAPDDPASRALWQDLNAEGHAGEHLTEPDTAVARAAAARPDVIVIAEDPSGRPALEVVAALKARPETRDVPVCLLLRAWDPARLTDLLDAEVDDAVAPPMDGGVLAARLRPLVRMSTMRAALTLRIAAANRFGIEVSDRISIADERPQVLVAGAEDDVARVRSAVGNSVEITATDSLFEAESLMNRRIFDCFVMAATGSADAALDLCTQIRRNPRLFNLPVVLMIDEAPDVGQQAHAMGASQVLSRAPGAEELRWAVFTLVRRQQTRWAIRRALDRSRAPALLSEDLPDLYTREMLCASLTDHLTEARKSGKALSVIRFGFGGVNRIASEFGDEAARHLRRQLGQWITSLIRAEDLAAHLGEARFAVVLPDTPLDEAQVVMHRIAGVIGYTDFAVQDVYEVVKVWPRVGGAEARPEDTADSLLDRAEAQMED
ncbi:diguanylate cyclase domain-containing protein [Caenispirillum salinarum]|uniref:diguanylate cyclase domain-containing protein n=1 Tax=Caenispirillum salinarum TaxID=859058 RepID=UPI003851377B